MLKMTGVKLEVTSDLDIYQFTEKDMGGVISYIAKRYSLANSKYMKSQDDSKPSNYVTHLEGNNLY